MIRRGLPVKYIATIHDVRELCLVGHADLHFWSDRLASEGSSPADINGHAELWLSAVELKWMGTRFRELTVAVRLDPDHDAVPRVFLVAAYSTSRMFAWCERAFFQTPYQYAPINLHASQPRSFELRSADHTTLSAESRANAATASADEIWTGRILLPTAGTHGQRKLFHAQLSGQTEIAPFNSATSQLMLRPSHDQPVVQLLAKSNFTPNEWRARQSATHARSKTFLA